MLLQIFSHTIQNGLSILQSGVSDGQSVPLVQACLSALIPFSDWASFTALVNAHILSGLSALLGSPQLFFGSCEALT
jgi:hypothetical protein